MNVSCDIIRDILPLYAEDMVSEDTRQLVDGHLSGCAACAKELENLKQRPRLPVDTDAISLERVSRGIRARRALAVLCVVMTLLTAVVTGYQFMTTPVYLPADKAVEGVYLGEDGGLVIDYARGVNSITNPGRMNDTVVFYCGTTRYNWLEAKRLDKTLSSMTDGEVEAYIKEQYGVDEVEQKYLDRFYGRVTQYSFVNQYGVTYICDSPEPDPYYAEKWGVEGSLTPTDPNYNLAYLEADGSVKTVLWNGNPSSDPTQTKYEHVKPSSDGNSTVVSLRHSFGEFLWAEICCGCLIGVAVLAVWLLLWKNRRGRELLFGVLLLLASAAFSILLMSSCDFGYASLSYSYEWAIGFQWETLLVFLTALLWRRWFVLRKRDMAM